MRIWREYFADILNKPDKEEQEQETTDYYRPEQETEEPPLIEVGITTWYLKNNEVPGDDKLHN